jgi:cytochrome c553
MRGIAGSLSEQDMADLAPSTKPAAARPPTATPAPNPPAPVAELLKRALRLLPRREPEQADRPELPQAGGQHGDYLYVALKAYQTDGNAQVGRGNAIMAGMAKPFSHAELKQLAGYLATLPGDLKTVPESRFR